MRFSHNHGFKVSSYDIFGTTQPIAFEILITYLKYQYFGCGRRSFYSDRYFFIAEK